MEYETVVCPRIFQADVCEFAAAIGIHPGIVVGRLQHDGLIEPSWMNDLRESFRLIAAK